MSHPTAIIERLQADGRGVLADRTLADLAGAAERLEQARCNVVMLGAFKRGKSTLLNALLERDVLPTGVLPLTSVATIVRAGERERLVVRLDDGRVEEHPLAALPDLVTEPLNPGNGRGVAVVEVHLAHPLLARGLQLVDTPGIGSVHSHNSRAAYEALGRVDAALCVMSADQPLAEQELELYRAAASQAGQTLHVLTKTDRLSDAECDQAVAFVAAMLREHGLADAEPDVLAVSGLDGRGLAELRAQLARLVVQTGGEVVATALHRRARAAALELARRCELEERALELPLEQLRKRGAALEDRLAELQAADRDVGDLMHRRVARMLEHRVNAPLLAYAREHDDALQQALRDRAAQLPDRSPRALATELDHWIDETVRSAFAELSSQLQIAVAAGLEDAAAAHAERVERLLEQVQEAADHALGVRGSESLRAVPMAEPVGFTFKLRDPDHAVDIVVGSARRAVPGRIGRRLVLGDAAERLRAMTDRHAGRLRSELVARAEGAAADHRRRMAVTLSEACAAVRSAITGAREERERGDATAATRLRELRDRRARALDAARQLGHANGSGP